MALRLWSEIPEHERMSKADLAKCGGASHLGWVDRQLEAFNGGCLAAVPWYGWHNKYGRCRLAVLSGEHFCTKHGGKRKPSDTPADARKRICDRLERKIKTERGRIEASTEMILIWQAQLDALRRS